MVVRENPRSAVFEILRPAGLEPTTIPRSKSLKSPFFPILMLGFAKYIELLPCDWLIRIVCYQAIEQVYLIKWPVSVCHCFWVKTLFQIPKSNSASLLSLLTVVLNFFISIPEIFVGQIGIYIFWIIKILVSGNCSTPRVLENIA